jgi:hypothetical protein
MTLKRERQLELSATTFLTLCVAWGPNRACFVIVLVGGLWGWFAVCRRYPVVAYATLGFIRGLTGR